MQKQVEIIGAGVIGLILAKLLASRQIQTTVYETKKSVSENAAKASGIISFNGIEQMGIDYKKSVVNELYGAMLHAGKETFKIRSQKLQAYILDRAKLVQICKDEAQAAGALINTGRKMSKEEILSMAQDKHTIIVGADGAISTVARTLKFPPLKNYVLTYKAEYQRARVNDKSMVELFFSKALSKDLFGWIAPYSFSDIELGIGIGSSSKQSSAAAFKKFLNLDYIQEITQGSLCTSQHASIIPLGPRAKTVKHNVILVGDAAGQVKATTGGGLVFGSICAKIAADAIEAHIKNNSTLDKYEKQWRKKLGNDIKLHNMIQKYYSSAKSLEKLFLFAKLFGAESFLSKYGDMDMPSLMLKRVFFRKLE